MEKSKKNMDGILIVILLAVICIGGFIIYSSNIKIKKQNEEINQLKIQKQESNVNLLENQNISNKEESNEQKVSNQNQTQNKNNKKIRDMKESEIVNYEDMFNTYYNGYVVSTNLYSKPSEIDFTKVFYNKNSTSEYTNEEIKAYEQVAGSLYTDLRKVETNDIKIEYKNHTGEEISDAQLKEIFKNWVYLKEYDAFYNQAGDTNLEKIKIVSGTVDESEATYVDGDCNGTVYFTINLENGNTVKLKEVHNGYGVDIFFISNVKTK